MLSFGATKRTHPCMFCMERTREDTCYACLECKQTHARCRVALPWPIPPLIIIVLRLDLTAAHLAMRVRIHYHVPFQEMAHGNKTRVRLDKEHDVEGFIFGSLEQSPGVVGQVLENGGRRSCPPTIVPLHRNSIFHPRTCIACFHAKVHIGSFAKEAIFVMISCELFVSKPGIFEKLVFPHELNYCSVFKVWLVRLMHETNHGKESASNVRCCACMGCCYDPFSYNRKVCLACGLSFGHATF